VSIVRVGLSENQKFADGYDAIFGKKKGGATKPTVAPRATSRKPAKKAAQKKPGKKK
jgi:hypothetical protein